MKKSVRLPLAAALVAVLALAFAALGAAETGPGEYTAPIAGTASAEAFDERSAPYEGTWVIFDDGFRLYLPSEWVYFEITEEQAQAGLFYRAGNDGSDSVVGDVPMGVAVSYVEAGGLTTLYDLVRDFASVGFAGLEAVELNGMPAVAFEKEEDDYRGVAFYHPYYPQYVLAVYVTPFGAGNEAVTGVGSAILASLSPQTPKVGE